VKKDVKSKVVAKKWLDGRLMANNDNLGEFGAKSWRRQPELSLLNFFFYWPTIKPFLGWHLGFHIFFHNGLPQGRTLFFTAELFWIRCIYSSYTPCVQ